MVKGSCLCGNLAYEYTGDPVSKVACHCVPCRKTSGTTNSYNLVVPNDKFNVVSGKARTFKRKGISGKDLTYNMCDHCGSLVFVEMDVWPDFKIVKMGTVDDSDILNNFGYPESEIFTKDRLSWAHPIAGAEQTEVS